jgi:recombination protein RecR
VTYPALERLIAELNRLPGLGERTAARMAYYIVRSSKQAHAPHASLAHDLAQALLGALEHTHMCSECGIWCESDVCNTCQNIHRNNRQLCVVENVSDVRAVENTGVFKGLYHVLHGVLAPLQGIGPEELKLNRLVERVHAQGFEEVILATNAHVEGDATAMYITQLLQPLGVKITRLASGIPRGGELEYLDKATVSKAFQDRR